MHNSAETNHDDAVQQRPRIRVKFVAKGHQKYHQDIFLRQFPRRKPVWGNCEFDFDPDARTYDWLAVYDDLPPYEGERFSTRIESLNCAPQHTSFITMEPSSIKTYGYDFLNQFGVILTSRNAGPSRIRRPSTLNPPCDGSTEMLPHACERGIRW